MNKAKPTIEDVRAFWQNNPLFSGEGGEEVGSLAWFMEHERVVINDGFVGEQPGDIFTRGLHPNSRILDVGCGPGLWVRFFLRKGFRQVQACDLTPQAVNLARKSLRLFDLHQDESIVREGSAEELPYPDGSFDHVNCQGVIHHTPNTEKCIAEFHRVLAPEGTACFSVYYKNFFLRHPGLIRIAQPLLQRLLVLKGRGREASLLADHSPDEIVRKYDGADNPVGKAYSLAEMRRMVEPYFHIVDTQRTFFPARALPFPLPKGAHRWLNRKAGLLIVFFCHKKS